MFTEYLRKYAVHYHLNQGITVCSVKNQVDGIVLAKGLLYELVDRKTALYLSGGSMRSLYEVLAKEETIIPGAVGLIDERFGPPMHANSNEKMIKESGFLRYLQMLDIPFYSVLQSKKDREEAADAYDEKVRSLQSTFQKQIGLIGIGPDGHISSVIPNRKDFHNPWFDPERQHLLVSEFDDPNSKYKERVGMTFLGLSMLDSVIILAFGEQKKEALDLLFETGKEEDLPARFFKRPEIADKTVLITDQPV